MAERDYREEHRKNVTNVLQDSFGGGSSGVPRRGSLTGLKQRKLSSDTWLERCGLDKFESVVKDAPLPASIVKQQEQQRIEQQRMREQQLREQAEEQQRRQQEQQRRHQEQQRREREAFLKRQQDIILEQEENERISKHQEQARRLKQQEHETYLRSQSTVQTPIIANKTTSINFIVGNQPAKQPIKATHENGTLPLTNGISTSHAPHNSSDFIDGSRLEDASAIVDSVDEKIRALDSLLDEFDSSLNNNSEPSSFTNEQQYPITKTKKPNPTKRYSMEEINDLSSSLNTLLNDLDNNKTYFKFDELEAASQEIDAELNRTRQRTSSSSSRSSDSGNTGNRKVSFNIEEESTIDTPGVHQVSFPKSNIILGANQGRDYNQELADAYANQILPLNNNGTLAKPKPINITVSSSSRSQPVRFRSASEGKLIHSPKTPISPPTSPRRSSASRNDRSTWLERAGLDENKKVSLT